MTRLQAQEDARAPAAVADIARRVASRLRMAIRQEEFPPRSPLPSERVLARRFRCTRHQVRSAIEQLVGEGRLRRLGRSGTFVEMPGDDSAHDTPDRVTSSLKCLTFVQFPATTTGALREAILGRLLAGYTEALESSGVKMRFVLWDGKVQSYNSLFAPDVPLRQQGCVLADVLDAGLMGWLKEQGVPFAVQYFCNYRADGIPPHHAVFVDKVEATRSVTRRLIDLGHRRIGFLGIVRDIPNDPSIYNYHGFKAAMEWAGLSVRPAHAVHTEEEGPMGALDLAAALLRPADRPTAVVAQTDGLAIAILKAAADLGVRVPDDLSVIGFNDQAEAALTRPPLTTLASPLFEQGKEVVNLALGVAEGRWSAIQTRILNCRFVERQSIGPPPA